MASGPAPIPNGLGKAYMAMTEPQRTITLDAGSFDWLWRLVEVQATKAESVGQRGNGGGNYPEYVNLVHRTREVFRQAAEETPQPLVRKLRRPRTVYADV